MPLSSATNVETVTGLSSWVVCSVGMMVFNKLAIKAFPVDCTLVAIQMGFTAAVFILYDTLSGMRSIHIGSFHDALRWMMVIPFYTGMLLTSVLALGDAPMTLVVAFRALCPLPALLIEWFYPNPLRISRPTIVSLVVMLTGSAIYVLQLPDGGLRGIQWVMLNMFFAVGDPLLQRLMLAKDQNPVDISKGGCTVLNNAVGLIPILIIAVITQEYKAVPGAMRALHVRGAIWVICSCFVGAGISYTGIWAQSLISATSILVLVNANKFVILFMEACVMRTKYLGRLQLLGAILTIVGGIMYGWARQEVENEKRLKEKMEEDEEERVPLVKDVHLNFAATGSSGQ